MTATTFDVSCMSPCPQGSQGKRFFQLLQLKSLQKNKWRADYVFFLRGIDAVHPVSPTFINALESFFYDRVRRREHTDRVCCCGITC